MYIPNSTKAEVEAEVRGGVRVQKAVDIGVAVLLPLVGASKTCSASLSLSIEGRL